MKPTCEVCRFWRAWEKQPTRWADKAHFVIGDCLKHAPTMETGCRTDGAVAVSRTKFPSRPHTSWCGEHEANWEMLEKSLKFQVSSVQPDAGQLNTDH